MHTALPHAAKATQTLHAQGTAAAQRQLRAGAQGEHDDAGDSVERVAIAVADAVAHGANTVADAVADWADVVTHAHAQLQPRPGLTLPCLGGTLAVLALYLAGDRWPYPVLEVSLSLVWPCAQLLCYMRTSSSRW